MGNSGKRIIPKIVLTERSSEVRISDRILSTHSLDNCISDRSSDQGYRFNFTLKLKRDGEISYLIVPEIENNSNKREKQRETIFDSRC